MIAARSGFDRSKPPAAGKPEPFKLPAFQHTRLDSGLRILAARSPRVPLSSLQILIPAGGQFDTLDHPGLANLHGAMLDEGTDRRSSLEIARLVEGLGGSASSGAGWNSAWVEVAALSRHLGSSLELLAEIVRSPGFPQREIDRLRLELRAEMLRRKGDPSSLAGRFFAAAVYRGTIYGQQLIGTEDSLDRLDRECLRDFYRRLVRPDGATVIAVGDLDPEAETARIEGIFGDWRSPASRPGSPASGELPEIEPPTIARTEVHIVNRPESSQTQLQLGHASLPRYHPDFPRMLLLNAIFGGKFTSRINLNLREKHGFTYGAHSFFARRRGPGPFVVSAAVANDVAGAAVEQVLLEMRRIREQPVDRDEIRETQDYLVGVFPYTLQTIGDLARRLEAIAVFDLPLDYYDSYPAVLYDFGREDLLEVAGEHLHPDNLVIVAVGPAEELSPQLEGFGPVTVHAP